MANEVYVNNGISLLINGEVGADYAFSVEGILNGTGRVSAQIDLGSAPRPHTYQWSCEIQFQATPTAGVGLNLHLATAPDGDATQIDGDVGNIDAALGNLTMVDNLDFLGSVISENATASEKCVSHGEFTTTARYISIVAVDASGASVNATDSNFRFNMQPKYSQGQ